MPNQEDRAYHWFVDKLLPSIILIIVFGLFTLYVTVISLEKGTQEYRKATENYREKSELKNHKQVELILQNRENIIRLKHHTHDKNKLYK